MQWLRPAHPRGLLAVVPQIPDWKAYRAKFHTSTDELAVYHIAGLNPNSKNGR
jgi:hypothetical protein